MPVSATFIRRGIPMTRSGWDWRHWKVPSPNLVEVQIEYMSRYSDATADDDSQSEGCTQSTAECPARMPIDTYELLEILRGCPANILFFNDLLEVWSGELVELRVGDCLPFPLCVERRMLASCGADAWLFYGPFPSEVEKVLEAELGLSSFRMDD